MGLGGMVPPPRVVGGHGALGMVPPMHDGRHGDRHDGHDIDDYYGDLFGGRGGLGGLPGALFGGFGWRSRHRAFVTV